MDFDSIDFIKEVLPTLFGAAMVWVYSWRRFDEPSDGWTKYFTPYQLRSSTSHSQYVKAKLGYIFLIIIFYVTILAVPWALMFDLILLLFEHPAIHKGPGLPEGSEFPKGPEFPLVVALLIITLRELPPFTDVERWIRSRFHALARIPDGVRRTVEQMRASLENVECDAEALASQIPADPDELKKDDLIKISGEDKILCHWCRLARVLCALEHRSGINTLFFENYRGELQRIQDEHANLAILMRESPSGDSMRDYKVF